MALIKCPECKNKISDKCGKCPNCGYPIEFPVVKQTENTEKQATTQDKKQSTKERKPINNKLLISIISVAIVLLTTSGVFGYKALLHRKTVL